MPDSTKKHIDLEYPTVAHGRIPAFHSVEEEAAFWDTHDLADFLDDLEPVEVTTAAGLAERLTIRLEPEDRAKLARRAKRMGVGPSTLARIWLKERLRQESENDANANG
ncbi:MAG TPA: CopG family antitoxin [Thermomicrobiaceae bacterium]|nr:CopG family antitoxin [Thermomicrobiaceae bacterium]